MRNNTQRMFCMFDFARIHKRGNCFENCVSKASSACCRLYHRGFTTKDYQRKQGGR